MANEKNILIGGITGGIGSSLAKRLKDSGHNVVGFARDQEKSAKFQDETGIETAICEATDPEAVEATISELAEKLGEVDAYVHAIGSIFIKPAHLTPVKDWEQTILLNLSSAFFALRVVTKLMQKQGYGSSLFFSTAAAQTGIANHEAIAAAKGGIEAMVRSAAASYSSRGLRFNAIAPSLTDTPLAKPIIGSEQALEISKRMHPLGDITHAEDVAGLAAWLISDEARSVTGQTFVIDGGLSSVVPKPKA
jgi:NAD(P)-dependent dehydrogenase (short-subunit alcohol dehydrogenase family)